MADGGCRPVPRAVRFIRAAAALVAALAASGCADFAELVDDARAVARIGVVAHPEVEWPKSTERLQKALAYFRRRRVDAVVILGELTKDGYMNQYRVLAQAWDKVFRDPVKGVDPHPPRRICVLGGRERVSFVESYGDALEGTLFADGGEFDVGGFRFRAFCGRRPSSPPEADGRVVPVFFSDGKPALTDELCFYPRVSAAVRAGSLSGVAPRQGYEPVQAAGSASQGLVVTAYGDEAVVERIDFVHAERVAPDWRIPLRRADVRKAPPDAAPQFWADTRLKLTRGQSGQGPVYKLEWPPVLAKYTGVRAGSYEVEALLVREDGRTAAIKRAYVLSPSFHLSEERDTAPVFCNFYASEFAEGSRVRFAVTPVSALGARGRPLVSEDVVIGR